MSLKDVGFTNIELLDYGKSFEFSFTVVIAKKDDRKESLTRDIKKLLAVWFIGRF